MAWHHLKGWFDYQDIYEQAAEEARDGDTLVEIGVGFGRSLAFLAAACIRRAKAVRIVGVDPFLDDMETARPTWGANFAEFGRSQGGPYEAFRKGMLEHCPKELEYVEIIRDTSRNAVGVLAAAKPVFVFIDGSHYYEDVVEDIRLYREALRPGGALAGHDYSTQFPGVSKAVMEVLGTPGKDFVIRGTSWWHRKT